MIIENISILVNTLLEKWDVKVIVDENIKQSYARKESVVENNIKVSVSSLGVLGKEVFIVRGCRTGDKTHLLNISSGILKDVTCDISSVEDIMVYAETFFSDILKPTMVDHVVEESYDIDLIAQSELEDIIDTTKDELSTEPFDDTLKGSWISMVVDKLNDIPNVSAYSDVDVDTFNRIIICTPVGDVAIHRAYDDNKKIVVAIAFEDGNNNETSVIKYKDVLVVNNDKELFVQFIKTISNRKLFIRESKRKGKYNNKQIMLNYSLWIETLEDEGITDLLEEEIKGDTKPYYKIPGDIESLIAEIENSCGQVTRTLKPDESFELMIKKPYGFDSPISIMFRHDMSAVQIISAIVNKVHIGSAICGSVKRELELIHRKLVD